MPPTGSGDVQDELDRLVVGGRVHLEERALGVLATDVHGRQWVVAVRCMLAVQLLALFARVLPFDVEDGCGGVEDFLVAVILGHGAPLITVKLHGSLMADTYALGQTSTDTIIIA